MPCCVLTAAARPALSVGLYLLFPGGFALCGLLFAVAALCAPSCPAAVSPADALQRYQQNSTDTLYGDGPPVVVTVPSAAAGPQSEA